MQKLLFSEKTPEERLKALKANADKMEELTYTKPLTQEELDEYRENYSDKSIEFSKLDDEKKVTVSSINDQVKPVKKDLDLLLRIIKTKAIEITDETYLFADHETGMMEYFDGNGEMVYARRLRPEEKQTTINSQIRKIS